MTPKMPTAASPQRDTGEGGEQHHQQSLPADRFRQRFLQGPDVVERQVFFNLVDSVLDHLGRSRRIGSRANDQAQRTEGLLPQREVRLEGRGVLDAVLFDIFHHPHHFPLGVLGFKRLRPALLHPLSDRVLIGPEAAGQGLIDDGDPR
jgi:hypothetical protein